MEKALERYAVSSVSLLGPDSISISAVYAASSRILTNYLFSFVLSQTPSFYRENEDTGVWCGEISIVSVTLIERTRLYIKAHRLISMHLSGDSIQVRLSAVQVRVQGSHSMDECSPPQFGLRCTSL